MTSVVWFCFLAWIPVIQVVSRKAEEEPIPVRIGDDDNAARGRLGAGDG